MYIDCCSYSLYLFQFVIVHGSGYWPRIKRSNGSNKAFDLDKTLTQDAKYTFADISLGEAVKQLILRLWSNKIAR